MMDAPNPAKPARVLDFDRIAPEKLRDSPGLVKWVMPMVAKACEHSYGRFEPEGVIASCAGLNPHWKAQLWVIGYRGGGEPPTIEAVAVTCINTFETGRKVLDVVLVGGQGAKDWIIIQEPIAQWAAHNGCDEMQTIGRRGWERTLGEAWSEQARVFIRPLPKLKEGGHGEGV